MNDLINGRTPEVIKSNLSYLVRCEICPQNHEYGCDYDKQTEECRTVIDSLAYIEHLEAKQPKWIKLTEDDRPPDGYYNVMVKKRGVWQRDLLRYDANDDDWWKELSTHDELVPGYLITHWMPLPKAPEEEG